MLDLSNVSSVITLLEEKKQEGKALYLSGRLEFLTPCTKTERDLPNLASFKAFNEAASYTNTLYWEEVYESSKQWQLLLGKTADSTYKFGVKQDGSLFASQGVFNESYIFGGNLFSVNLDQHSRIPLQCLYGRLGNMLSI